MLAELPHLLFKVLMTAETQLLLRHGQQGSPLAFMGLMAGQALVLTGRRMVNTFLAALLGVAVQAKLFGIACQQVLLS